MYAPNLKQTPVRFYRSDFLPPPETIEAVDWGQAETPHENASFAQNRPFSGLGGIFSSFFEKLNGHGHSGEGLLSSLLPEGGFRFDRLQKDDLILLGLIFLLFHEDYDIELLLALGFIFLTGL